MAQVEDHVERLASDVGAYRDVVASVLSQRRASLDLALAQLAQGASLAEVAAALVHALRHGGTILLAGNGGSAAEAQHFAAELVGRFQVDRQPFAAQAISTDSSIVTAVANDYGYDEVFARQVMAAGRPGDVLVLFSTSGESENIVRAAAAARQRAMTVVAITGDHPSRVEQLAHFTVRAPGTGSAAIQEVHLIVTHVLCGIVERELGVPRGEL